MSKPHLDPQRYDSIRVTIDRGVAVVTIDRPPRNALVPTTMIEFRDAMAQLDADDDVRCVVLTGAGTHFCSGADLTRPGLLDPETGTVDRPLMKQLRADHRRDRGLANRDLPELRVPVIAAINGSAVGGGLTMTLAADIRIIAEDATISFAFVRLGLGPEHGMTWLLPHLVGLSVALDLLLTGRRIDGREALRLGLVARALPADEVLPAALEAARTIADGCSPLATAVTKQMTWAHAAEPSFVRATRNEKAVIEWITQQPDAAEGIRSYREKRPPRWSSTGREELPAFVPSLFETAVEEY